MNIKNIFRLALVMAVSLTTSAICHASQCVGSTANGGCQICWGGTGSYYWQTRNCGDGSYDYNQFNPSPGVQSIQQTGGPSTAAAANIGCLDDEGDYTQAAVHAIRD